MLVTIFASNQLPNGKQTKKIRSIHELITISITSILLDRLNVTSKFLILKQLHQQKQDHKPSDPLFGMKGNILYRESLLGKT